MNEGPPFSPPSDPPDALPLAEGSLGSLPREAGCFFEALGSFEPSQHVCSSRASTDILPCASP